jgi:hypothetical protein
MDSKVQLIYPTFKEMLYTEKQADFYRWMIIHNPDVPIKVIKKIPIKNVYDQYEDDT